MAKVEIRNVDPMASREDVLNAFRKIATKGDCIECKVLRTGLLSMQVPVVACSAQRRVKLQTRAKLKLGWSLAR